MNALRLGLLHLLLPFSAVFAVKHLSESAQPGPVPPEPKQSEPQATKTASTVHRAKTEETAESSPSKRAEDEQCCPRGWLQFKGHCYKGVQKRPLAFYNVQKACKKMDADFVSIHSEGEYAFVKKHFDLDKYWIGVVSYPDGHQSNEDGSKGNFAAKDDPVWHEWEKHPYICKKREDC